MDDLGSDGMPVPGDAVSMGGDDPTAGRDGDNGPVVDGPAQAAGDGDGLCAVRASRARPTAAVLLALLGVVLVLSRRRQR